MGFDKDTGEFMDCTEFLNGMRACDNGEPCPDDASSDFVRGYSAQYEMDQISDEMTYERKS